MYILLGIYVLLAITVSAMLLFRNTHEAAGKRKSKIDFGTYIIISIYVILGILLMIIAHTFSSA